MSAKFVLSAVLVIGFGSLCLAAPPPPSGGPGCWPPPCVPIDGGISLLIAAGALYGGKTLYDRRKRKNSAL